MFYRYILYLTDSSSFCIYRNNLRPNDCVLCGNDKCTKVCTCPTSTGCKECVADIELRTTGQIDFGQHYSCSVHGRYRHYEDMLMR